MNRRFWPVVAVLAGLALGAVDLLMQRVLPYPWANLANSSAVWAVGAFLFGRWLRRGWWRSALGSALLLVIAVSAYYVSATLTLNDDLGNLYSPVAFFWMAAGIGAGLLFGAAGDLSVRATGWLRAAAAALPSAVLLAEAAVLAQRGSQAAEAGYRADSLRTAIIEALLGVLLLVLFARGVLARACVAAVVLAGAGFLAFRVAGFGG